MLQTSAQYTRIPKTKAMVFPEESEFRISGPKLSIFEVKNSFDVKHLFDVKHTLHQSSF